MDDNKDKINQSDSDGYKHGLWITDRFNKKVESIIHSTYEHGVLNGISKVFREGNLIYQCNYKNGLLNGLESRHRKTYSELNFYENEIYEGEQIYIE